MRRFAAATAIAALALSVPAAGAEEPKPAAEPAAPAAPGHTAVEQGAKVSIEYTLVVDGATADTNVGGEPLVFEQGAHEILPALEEALAGMKVSESRKVTLGPEKGYGPVDERLRQEVDPQLIPEDARHEGAALAAEDTEGNRHFARVIEVREDKIVVDTNHPLAGKTLSFDVKILAID
jgi:FKBP-type peptidyl-prolyl cis-trans isomerase 2